MPRIPHGALEGIVYLYPSVADAENGSRLGGSGFFVMMPSMVIPGGGVLYAVTNAHVIENGSTVIRLNTKDGKFDTFDFTERQWVLHPDKDDVAVCPMPELDPDLHIYKEIGPGTLLKRYEIDAATLLKCRLSQSNKTESLENSSSFLVEARSISGYSGSPVFLTDVFRLLGIQWGYIQDWEPIRDSVGRDTGLKVHLNTGMMGVVPAWKLGDLLRSDILVEHRKKVEEKYSSKHS